MLFDINLNPIGWLDGLTALAVVSAGIIVGILSFYKGTKLKSTLLIVTGLATMSAGFILLGASVDLIHILFTEDNLDPYWLYGLLSYTWTAPITIFGLYIGAELLAPNRKKLIVSIYAVLSVIFEIIVFYYSLTNPEAIYRLPEDPHGTALLNTSMNPRSIAFILMLVFLISGLIFNGFGFLSKSRKAAGAIRRKFLYLSLGWIVFIICGALDGLFDPGIYTFFIRIGLVASISLMYLGVRG
ncbi:MAG: hypothetical protein EAX91_04280 [Candidatus Lokiarchaeota archaeon]|nr:hypothetical protein [Candidatus Lokiarchaeota archaeon]